MKDLFDKLEQIINQNFDNAMFSEHLNPEDIKQFEIENNWNLPQDLKQFFLWQNGIQINDKFSFLSLQEAFEQTKEFQPETFFNDAEFSSTKEAQIFKNEMEDYMRKSVRQKDFWLPVFIQTTVSKPIIHVIWLSEIDAQNSNWVKINLPQIPQAFDFKFIYQNDYSLNCYSEISALLHTSMEILNPEETSFWTELKGTLSLFGKIFD